MIRMNEKTLQVIAGNLASLNEILTEITAAVSEDPQFVTLVRDTLRGHSHALGFRFQGERPPHCQDGCDFEILSGPGKS
jgi:hypothetical protein